MPDAIPAEDVQPEVPERRVDLEPRHGDEPVVDAPGHPDALAAYAAEQQVPANEAWRRLVHATAIDAVASQAELAASVVLRGSTSLWLRYGGPRTPGDVDLLTLAFGPDSSPEVVAQERRRVQTAVALGLARRFRPWVKWREKLLASIKIQVSPVHTLVPSSAVPLPFSPFREIRAAHLDYLVVEKLFGALRGVERNYVPDRVKDLWDLHWMLDRRAALLDWSRVMVLCAAKHAAEPLQAGWPRPEMLTDAVRERFAAAFEARMGRHADRVAFSDAWTTFEQTLDRVAAL